MADDVRRSSAFCAPSIAVRARRCAGAQPVAVAGRARWWWRPPARRLGGEFMPKLEEGNFWIRASLPTSIVARALVPLRRPDARHRAGLPRRRARAARRRRSARFPEIETVISQVGRPDDGTDVSGFSNIELFAPLRPTTMAPRHHQGRADAEMGERLRRPSRAWCSTSRRPSRTTSRRPCRA